MARDAVRAERRLVEQEAPDAALPPARPDPAAALLALQHSAGNAAVAALLAGGGRPKRTEVAAPGALDHPTPGALNVKLVEYGQPKGFPVDLGETNPPQLGTYRLPQVSTQPAEGGGVRLQTTEARDSEDFYSASAPPGTFEKPDVTVHLFREFVSIAKDQGFPTGQADLVTDREGPTALNDPGWTVCFRIDGPTAQLIRDNEQEHPNDFAQAFVVSALELAAQVALLKDQPFDDDREAMQTLLAKLHPKLRPRYPMVPDAWRQHLGALLVALYDLSKDRDRRHEHHPVARGAEIGGPGKRLTIWPIVGTPGAKPSVTEITLDRANFAPETPVFDMPEPPWAKGQGLLVAAPFDTTTYDRGLTAESTARRLHKNAFGTFTGQVVHERRLWLRIELEGSEGPVVLLDPANAARFVPGVSPGPPTDAPPPPPAAEVAATDLAARDTVRFMDSLTPVRFFDKAADAKAPQGKSDAENGPARGFLTDTLTVEELVGDDTVLVSKLMDWGERFYAVVPAGVLRR